MRRSMATPVVVMLGLVVAGDAWAQSRAVVPIIVNRPATGAGQTRIVIQGPPAVAGVGTPGTQGGGASVPSSPQEVRIITREAPASVPPPVTSGSRETRVTVEEAPRSAGMTTPSGSTQSFGNVPSFSRDLRVRVEERDGSGAPATTRELRILVIGDVQTPLVIEVE